MHFFAILYASFLPNGIPSSCSSARACSSVLARGHDRDLHAAEFVDLVIFDLRKDQLVLQAEGVVPTAVEGIGRDTAKVADARQGNVKQAVQEGPHAVAPQCDLGSDEPTFAQLEVGDAFAGLGRYRLLAGDRGQVPDGGLQCLGIIQGLANANIDDDLLNSAVPA